MNDEGGDAPLIAHSTLEHLHPTQLQQLQAAGSHGRLPTRGERGLGRAWAPDAAATRSAACPKHFGCWVERPAPPCSAALLRRTLQAFKFAIYVALPIGLTAAVVLNQDMLQRIIKSVSGLGVGARPCGSSLLACPPFPLLAHSTCSDRT